MEGYLKYLLIFCFFISCTKEIGRQGPCTVIEVFTEDTKTELDGSAVIWTASDVIVANGYSSSSIFINSPTNASFTFPAVLSAPLYCYGPASAFVSGSYQPGKNKFGTLILPSEQNYAEDSFDPAAALMVGVGSKANNVCFKQKVSYLKFLISSTSDSHKIKCIEVAARGMEDMSGELVYDCRSDALINTSENGATVKVSMAEPVEQGKAVIVAIPSKTYKSGIRIRIVDEKRHFQDLESKAGFTAVPGKMYKTVVNFVPEGTLVEAGTEEVINYELKTTPFTELNRGDDELNSHSGQTSRSVFTFVGGSYQELRSDITKTETPIYGRIIKTNDDRYLLFYHYAYAGESSIGWSGNMCAFLESRDLIEWTHCGMIFPRESGLVSEYDGKTYARATAGPDVVRLKDGTLIAAAIYHTNVDFRHRTRENGLVIKRSTDNGTTWSNAQYINVGTCWEPHPVQLSSGRVVIYYTDSCPYIEGVWTNNAVSSGVSYIYSDDNGLSWKPDEPLDKVNHLLAYRSVRAYKNGTYCYTDQMPVVVELNGTKTLFGVAESMTSSPDASDQYVIRTAKSDADGSWGVPDSKGVLPSVRNDNFATGASPFVVQFVSGETVVLYNSSSKEYFRFGDEKAENFSAQVNLFGATSKTYPKGYGFWGSLYADDHQMFLVTGGEGGTVSGGKGSGFFLQLCRFCLNHNIQASIHPVVLDGNNADWKKTDQALFAGSGSATQTYEKLGVGNMHSTFRCSKSGNKLYMLFEVEDSALKSGDYVSVYFADPSKVSISAGDIFLKQMLGGGLVQERYTAANAKSAADLGAEALVGRGNGCYLVEMSIPVSSLPGSKSVLVNLAVNDGIDGLQSINPTSSASTAKWQLITL